MDDQTKSLIQNHIDTNDVCLFMKGTPDQPQCGFSMTVSNILKMLEINFKGVNVLEDQSLRDGIKVFSDWPTIPQLYIKKEFIGGCDIIKEMFENGELKKILKENGIVHLKTDSEFFFGYTIGIVSQIGEVIYAHNNIYRNSNAPKEAIAIQTFYEKIFINQNKPIAYMKFRL